MACSLAGQAAKDRRQGKPNVRRGGSRGKLRDGKDATAPEGCAAFGHSRLHRCDHASAGAQASARPCAASSRWAVVVTPKSSVANPAEADYGLDRPPRESVVLKRVAAGRASPWRPTSGVTQPRPFLSPASRAFSHREPNPSCRHPSIDHRAPACLGFRECAGTASVVSCFACDSPFLPEGTAKHAPAAVALYHVESEGEPFDGMAHH